MPLVGGRGGLGRGLSAVLPEDPFGQNVEELSRRVEELSKRVEELGGELVALRRKESMTAEQTYVEALRFVRANPQVFALIIRRAEEAAAARRRFSVKRMFEDLRDEMPVSGSGAYAYRNAIAPVIARMVVAEVPEVGPYLKRGRSKVDKFFDGACEPPELAAEEQDGA